MLLDKELIRNKTEFIMAKNFIESPEIKFKELEEKINKTKNPKVNYIKDIIKYDIELNSENNSIIYMINDKTKIGKHNLLKKYKMEFKLFLFNKGLLNIIEKELNKDLNDFGNCLFKYIKFNEDYCSLYYKPFKEAFDRIIKNILKSNAAKKFFHDKYRKKFGNLEYHFTDDKLIDEILHKISFAPIYSENIHAYTDSVDLSITINSIPGKFGPQKINIFNRRILDFGRIVLFALHEIMGHYMRRYYSYVSYGAIPFDTKDDDPTFTGIESGSFIEREFLGFNSESRSNLTITETLFLLYLEQFDTYPINQIGGSIYKKEIFEKIVENYKDIFDFIGEGKNQIKLEDYLFFLTPTSSFNPHRNCYLDEEYIILN